MCDNPSLLAEFFHGLGRSMDLFDIKDDIRGIVCRSFLTSRAKGYLQRLPIEDIDTFEKIENQLLRLYKVTAAKFKDTFDSATKKGDETYKLFASRLQTLLGQYVKAKECDTFEKLLDLICADKLTGSLPASCREFIRLKNLDKSLGVEEVAELADDFLEDYDGTRETFKNFGRPRWQKWGQSNQNNARMSTI